jgi:hypothetical protein
MLKINKITIENFRGIKSPAIIDFYKGGRPTSALVYGRNGTGKSSIVDGWEWLINSKIEYLSKEGVSERDYPHKLSNGDNSYVEIDFVHPDINSAKAVFNKNRITSPTHSGEFEAFKKQTIYPNYLRYSDLQEFVYKRKGDKYRYIAKFFGLEQFLKNQADIQLSLTRILNQQTQFQNQLKSDEQVITKISGESIVNESTIVSFINTIAIKYKIDEVTEFKDSLKVKQALSEIVKANPIAVELAAWKAFQTRLNQFYGLPKVVQDCFDIETVFNELKKDEGNITKLILIELYSSATETLSELEDKTKCPVCDKTFGGDLVKHISEKHKVLESLNKKKTEYLRKREALIKKFELIVGKLVIIKSETNEKVLVTFNSFFNDIESLTTELPNSISELKKLFKDIESLNLSTGNDILKIDLISEKETEIKRLVISKIKALSEDKNSKDLATNFDNLIQIITAYSRFIKNERKVEYISNITTKLNLVLTKLTSFIQEQIQNTFTAIQTDLNFCYNFLESSNQFLKNPVIKLVTGRDKAVELEIEFADEKVSPAYKFMSESQVNSFGLAIFLSAVKHFNTDFKFIILDDVVNSFDAFKRPKVSQLLANRFSDFQVLMLTHDQIFFDTVQRAFPQWNRYKFTGWDFSTGPRCHFTNNYIEEIQKLIDDDDPIGAGQKLGRYLEMVFGIVNQNLKTPIHYKLENVYTLSEFYNPLVKRFKDKLKFPNKKHIITNLFSEFEQGTIFRNYCAHYKNESTQFTSDEIDAVFKKWLEIESQIYCETCKSYCHLESISNVEYVRCNCASLDLKDETKFIDS